MPTDPIVASQIPAQAFRFMELSPISSFGDDSAQANAARDMYQIAVDTVLSNYDFSVARRVAHLPPNVTVDTAPDPDLPYRYNLPADALILRHAYTTLPFRLDGRTILSAQGEKLIIRYSGRVSREADFSAPLLVAMSLQLAIFLSPQFVQSRSKLEALQAQLKIAFQQAIDIDHISASPQTLDLGQGSSPHPSWVGVALG